MSPTPSVAVVGGYGTVGRVVATLLRERHPELDLVVAGRRTEAAAGFAAHLSTLPGRPVRSAVVDVTLPDPLQDSPFTDVVVVAVNDSDDNLLRAAVRRGSAVVDVARWPHRVTDAQDVVAGLAATAPVVLASGWMAGVAAVVAAATTRTRPARHVDIDVLLSPADAAGPDSLAGFVDVHREFTLHEAGVARRVRGLSDPHRVRFSDGRTLRTRRLGSPEQQSLVETGLTRGAAVRISFGHHVTDATLAVLVGSGLWARLPRSWRFRLLHNPTPSGAGHEVAVTVQDGETRRTTVRDEAGQAHLTAAGAVLQIERILGPAGPPVGVSFPEQSEDPARDVATLRSLGVRIEPDF